MTGAVWRRHGPCHPQASSSLEALDSAARLGEHTELALHRLLQDASSPRRWSFPWNSKERCSGLSRNNFAARRLAYHASSRTMAHVT